MIDNFINNVYDAFTLESVTDIGDVKHLITKRTREKKSIDSE